MKFIFPKNYSFKYKLLGFIDYTTAILDCIIGFILYFILNIFIKNITTKLYIFIIIFFPIILFSIFGLGKENLLSVIFYMYQFFKKQNIYLYNKKKNKEKNAKQNTFILYLNSLIKKHSF